MEKIIAIILAALSFLVLLFIGLRSDLLKEGSAPGKPYSFHKFQLWIWTLVILPAFVLYWGFSPDHIPGINNTSLVLLGISGATAMTAEVIVATQKTGTAPSLKAVHLNSSGFWTDLLKDDNNQLSLVRLQQLIFTFVYVVIYVSAFLPHMQYPEFDTTTYTLMGISTGTFLLGKGLNK
ncbi:hypothetical protein [Taibaiella koreensis]|uniref:hypothetical protein n=1 Tax=Taibaiella koreensis TaxID=1268548 RepID=UPI000E59FEE7|nr:hypothetical protein [Taibaiella koreensis]